MQRSNSTHSYNSTPHSTSASEMASESLQQPVFGIVIALILLAMAVGILGNILVCLAVTRFRSLRRVANFYVASLAVADLLVCTAVVPPGLYLEFNGGLWLLSGSLCKIWGALDVVLSTSSILHLCVISIDRFHAIRAPIIYRTRRTPKMAIGRIAAVWVVSGFVAGPALFLIEKENNICAIYTITSKLYAWFSSLISFYIPCAITLFVYFRIYRAVRTRARRTIKPVPLQTVSMSIRDNSLSSHGSSFHEEQGGEQKNPLSNPGIAAHPPVALPSTEPATRPGLDRRTTWPLREMLSERTQAQKQISLTHERKAARTIGIVVGAFVICWLPFFIVYSVSTSLCTNGHQRIVCEAVPTMYKIFTWLGWCNSSLNPIIYTIFNRDFRQAFKKLLRCRKTF